MKTLRATALILAALFSTACGPLDVIEAGLEGLEIYITEARNDGEVIPAKAELMINDTRQALRMVDALDYGLKVCKDTIDTKQCQVREVRTAIRGWNEIYARGNFLDVNPTVTRVVRATSRALVALEAYYAARAKDTAPVPTIASEGPAAAARPRPQKSEKELKRELDEALKELDQAKKELKQ